MSVESVQCHFVVVVVVYKVQSTVASRTPRYYGHSANTDSTAHTCIGNIANNKGRTIRKLIGGGGEEPKKYSRQGKLNEKQIHARQLTLKIFMLWPKKIHTRNLITKKQSLPHNFSNGPSLLTTTTHTQKKQRNSITWACYVYCETIYTWKGVKILFIQTISQSSPIQFHFSVTLFPISKHPVTNRLSFTRLTGTCWVQCAELSAFSPGFDD